MAFKFGNTIRRSVEGETLARKMWDFFYYNVKRTRQSNSNINDEIRSWAGDFDKLLKEQPYEEVLQVWDYYVKDIIDQLKNGEHPYIYVNAKEWVDNYIFIAQRFYRYYRPIPVDDLEDYTKYLLKESWACDMELFYTSISKSVYALKQVLQAVKESNIDDNIKRHIIYLFGDKREYIYNEYKHWYKEPRIWNATLTIKKLCERIYSLLCPLGYPIKRVNAIVNDIRKRASIITPEKDDIRRN